MKIYFLLFVVFIACMAEDLIDPDTSKDENPDSSEESRIVGGMTASPGQFPYIVSFRTPSNWHFCAGSIIGSSWAVSAGHCVEDPLPSYVVAGNIFRTGLVTSYTVAKRIRHSSYNPDTLANDIGAVMVETPFVFNFYVQPIKLPTLYPTAGMKLTTSGWGATNRPGTRPADELQYLTINLLSSTECAEYGVPPGVLCSFVSRGKGVCFGDSGGPSADNDILYGITSFILKSCAAGNPDGLTDVRYFLPWICTNTGVC